MTMYELYANVYNSYLAGKTLLYEFQATLQRCQSGYKLNFNNLNNVHVILRIVFKNNVFMGD